MGEPFIVKVQVALAGHPGVLVYNRERTVEWQDHDPDTVEAVTAMLCASLRADHIAALLLGAAKAFHWATISEAGVVSLSDPAPRQDW